MVGGLLFQGVRRLYLAPLVVFVSVLLLLSPQQLPEELSVWIAALSVQPVSLRDAF